MVIKGLYLFLRILQFLLLKCIIGLEITQIILFKNYSGTNNDNTSWFQQHGIKYFYYVVIITTLVYILASLITFASQWKAGPHQKVICIEIIFLSLWLAVGFTNAYPIYFNDSKLSCNVHEIFQDITSRITECRIYFASMAIGWLMALLFLVTTIFSIVLWSQRDKIRRQSIQNEKDDDVPYPHPSSPIV